MSTRAKTRLVGWALVSISIWPLAQITLVYTHDVSPWKLAGWGMYSAPTKVARVSITVAQPNGAPVNVSRPDPALHEPLQNFLTSRIDLGRMKTPRALADRVFEVYPAIDRLWIFYVEYPVDRESARMVKGGAQYPFVRPKR